MSESETSFQTISRISFDTEVRVFITSYVWSYNCKTQTVLKGVMGLFKLNLLAIVSESGEFIFILIVDVLQSLNFVFYSGTTN